MNLAGVFVGALLGLYLTHAVWGALLGALLGYMLDQGNIARRAALGSASVAEVFFQTTFEFLGHVAKADGRVSEAEIDAARRLMQEFALGPAEVRRAIEFFRVGKAAQYDANHGLERLRLACAGRGDLLRTFIELQMRAALAGNGLSGPAHATLAQAAARLGFSALQFAYLEAALRGRQSGRSYAPGPRSGASLDACYAELEVAPSSTDQEIKKAYRRQMSRHHPDKLVAKGLPESMMQLAKEKTQRIQEAYEAIRLARGMR